MSELHCNDIIKQYRDCISCGLDYVQNTSRSCWVVGRYDIVKRKEHCIHYKMLIKKCLDEWKNDYLKSEPPKD